jgi:cardiolipin synthase A/B
VTLPRLLRRVALAVLGAQAATAGGLIAADAWRRRMRPQVATFPHTEPAELPLGESLTTVYSYGTALYEDMLEAIDGARERVLFESFIVKDDEVGQRFKAALIAAAERGVEVFVIYDVFANLVVGRAFFEFPPPVNVVRYPALKPGMLLLDLRKSGRDHRKLLVVDGEIAFVGGYNIGSAYATQWRDTHLRVRGPSAWELENAFVDFWNQHRGQRQPSLPEHGSTLWG